MPQTRTEQGTEAERSQPASTLAKYATDWLRPGAAADYAASRQPKQFRHYELEQEMVGGWLRLCRPGTLVLDLPCGTGRFSELVAACGHRLLRGDLSFTMVSHAQQAGPNEHALGSLCFDLAAPPLRPRCVDVVLLWRLFHHCRSDADRRLMLQRAAQLARQYVIVSFYNRASITYWGRRVLRAALRRPPKGANAIWARHFVAMAGDAGLELVDMQHYRPGISINSAACFRVVNSERG